MLSLCDFLPLLFKKKLYIINGIKRLAKRAAAAAGLL
jgi:hypothetical protein